MGCLTFLESRAARAGTDIADMASLWKVRVDQPERTREFDALQRCSESGRLSVGILPVEVSNVVRHDDGSVRFGLTRWRSPTAREARCQV